MADKPLLEADPIQVADHSHRTLVVHQATHYRAGAQGKGITQLIEPIELGGGKKSLQAIEGRTQGKAKIETAQIPTAINEQMVVLLGQQVIDRTHLAHQGK